MRTLLALLLILQVPACSEGFGLDDLAETYMLVSVNDGGLPYLESATPECDRFIQEGLLRFEPGNRYTLTFEGPDNCERGGGGITTLGRIYLGGYALQGRTLTFEVTVQGADPQTFEGVARGSDIVVTVPPLPPQTGPGLTLRFQPDQRRSGASSRTSVITTTIPARSSISPQRIIRLKGM